MTNIDSLTYLDTADVFISEVEYKWEDDTPVPTDDYIFENDFADDFDL